MKHIVTGLLLAGLLCACNDTRKTGSFPYRSYIHIFNEPAESEWRKLWRQTLQPVPEVSVAYDSGWTHRPGGKQERLGVFELPETGGEIVHLPHRIMQPNSALWYSRLMIIPEPGILRIRADDGAQLFIEGKIAHRVRGEYFAVDTAGSLQVAVRVLNNAMQGGLQAVSFATKAQFRKADSTVSIRRRWRNAIEKVMLADTPDHPPATRAVAERPRWGDLDSLERLFLSKPMPGPVLVSDGSGTRLVVLNDGRDSVHLYCGSDAQSLVRRSSGVGETVTMELPRTRPVHYQVTSAQTETPIHSVAVDTSDGFSFSVWADSQGGWDIFARHIFNTLAYDDAFSVGVGDLVSNGSDANQWEVLLRILSINPRVPYYLIPGNHDYDGCYDDLVADGYHAYTGNPKGYFGWMHGNAAFLALDLNAEFPIGIARDSDQYRWFHDQITQASWKEAGWRFVFVHQPLYSDGWEGYRGDEAIRDFLEPWMEQAAIDFVVSGHTHDYERGAKYYGDQHTRFIVLGGGGGTLEPSTDLPVSPTMDTVVRIHHMGRFHIGRNEARFEAVDTAGNIIDHLTFIK